MQVINTIEELDEKMRECDRAGLRSDDALRQVFAGFRMAPPTGAPDDPFSPEYRRFQLELYRQISGKDYQVANERTVFDVEQALRRPFPYSTGSCSTTGEQWMLLGFVMRALVLEHHELIAQQCATIASRDETIAQLEQHNRALARFGQRAAGEALGTIADTPTGDELFEAMRPVALPAGMATTEEEAKALHTRIANELAIEAAIVAWEGRGYVRLSAQVYNAPAEYERLAEGLPRLLAGAD